MSTAIRTPLPDLLIINPDVKSDERGFFMEVYRRDAFHKLGIDAAFVQTNHSASKPGVLRGLHFQWVKPLSKLIRVIKGRAYFVSVDLCRNTETFGVWHGVELSAENKRLLFVPFGFASGFCVLGDSVAEVEYQYDAHYNRDGEAALLWNDSDLQINWPIMDPMVSHRDQGAYTWQAWIERPEARLFIR